MTLATAIAALAPRNYWKLDETSGTFFTDSGSTPLAMQISGDFPGIGAVGPEVGTHAARLFTGGQAASSGAGISGWGDLSVGVLATTPSNGTPTAFTPFAGLGDVNNPTARGFRLQQSSSGQQAAQFGLGIQAVPQPTGTPWPQSFWHWYVWTYLASTHIWTSYVDLTTPVTLSVTPSPPLGTADSFWIKSNSPVVIAHFAYWPRVLSQTEVQTVSNQIQAWPYGEPINVPALGAQTPVDLTPVINGNNQILAHQATFMPQITDIDTIVPQIHTQTTTIQTQTTNIQSSVGANLAVGVQEVLDGITATIGGVGGAISKTIGNLFSGPAFDQLSPEDLGTACAPAVIDATLGVSVRYGIQMQCTSYADWYVFTGNADDYTTQTLGVLQIFRGGNEILRQGLHTLTHTVYPLPGVPTLPLNVGLELVPDEYQVVLTPAPETCWHLEALVQP